MSYVRCPPSISPPGDHFDYSNSNSNYVLLAEIVAKVSGTDFPTYLRQRFFDPLDLHMVVDAMNPIPGRAVNYDTDTGVLRPTTTTVGTVGEGALQTTPSELVRWADNDRRLRVGGPQLLAAQFADPVEMGPGGTHYGAGLFIAPDGGFGSPGDWLGFVSMFDVSPDRTRALAVSCNSWDIRVGTIVDPLMRLWTHPTDPREVSAARLNAALG